MDLMKCGQSGRKRKLEKCERNAGERSNKIHLHSGENRLMILNTLFCASRCP